MRAIWNGEVIAESDDVVRVDGYAYFPLESIKDGVLVPSAHKSVCHWKGQADYYSIRAGGQENRDAAWAYPEPSRLAIEAGIQGKIGFWKGVRVE